MLGVKPIFGRSFVEADNDRGSPEVVMLGYGYWQRRFGGNPAAVGRRIMVDGTAREIIGVLPQGFWFMDMTHDLVVPLRFERAKVRLAGYNFQAIGRLRPGVTLAQVDADVARMIGVALAKFPPPEGHEHQDDGGRAARAEGPPAARRSRRRHRQEPVGGDGDDRDGPAHRLRQRREPAARQDRGPRPGARRPRRHRRRPRPPRPRDAGREPAARPARRRRGHRLRHRRAEAGPHDEPGEAAAAGADRRRRDVAGVHARRVGRGRPRLRRDPGAEARPRPPRRGAPGRRPQCQRQPRPQHHPQHADDRPGGAGAGAADRLRPDDPHLPVDASRAARIHGTGDAADASDRHPRRRRQGRRPRAPHAAEPRRRAGGPARGHVGQRDQRAADDRHELAGSGRRQRSHLPGEPDSAAAPLHPDGAEDLPGAGHAAHRGPRLRLDGHPPAARRRADLRQLRPRVLGLGSGRDRQAHPLESERPVERGHRRGGRHASRRRRPAGAFDRVLAAAGQQIGGLHPPRSASWHRELRDRDPPRGDRR